MLQGLLFILLTETKLTLRLITMPTRTVDQGFRDFLADTDTY